MFHLETRILIVDDILGMREQVCGILLGLGYRNVVDAGNGEKAFQILRDSYEKKIPIGLIICDLNMPVMDGITFLGVVKGDQRFYSLPFLMLTAVEEVDKISEAASLGVSNYAVKPISASILSKKLQSVYLKHGRKVA